MKLKLFTLFAVLSALCFASCGSYDDTDLRNEVKGLDERLSALEGSSVATVEEQIKAIEASLDLLEKSDATLDGKVAELRDYVDNEISSAKDWTEATFATLEQYAELVTALAALETNAGTRIDEAIESMKGWVNESLTGYYTIAQTDAKVSALENADAKAQQDIADVRKELASAKTELTAAYRSAIAEAIADNNGVIDRKIAQEIVKVNDRIDREVAALDARISALETDVAALLARIQSVTFVPRYSDGKAALYYGSDYSCAELDYEIKPASAVDDIIAAWKKILSVKAVYTLTRAEGDFIDMPVMSVMRRSESVVTVTVSGENLNPDYLMGGSASASVAMSLSDGNTDITTEYVDMKTSYIDKNNVVFDKAEYLGRSDKGGHLIRLSDSGNFAVTLSLVSSDEKLIAGGTYVLSDSCEPMTVCDSETEVKIYGDVMSNEMLADICVSANGLGEELAIGFSAIDHLNGIEYRFAYNGAVANYTLAPQSVAVEFAAGRYIGYYDAPFSYAMVSFSGSNTAGTLYFTVDNWTQNGLPAGEYSFVKNADGTGNTGSVAVNNVGYNISSGTLTVARDGDLCSMSGKLYDAKGNEFVISYSGKISGLEPVDITLTGARLDSYKWTSVEVGNMTAYYQLSFAGESAGTDYAVNLHLSGNEWAMFESNTYTIGAECGVTCSDSEFWYDIISGQVAITVADGAYTVEIEGVNGVGADVTMHYTGAIDSLPAVMEVNCGGFGTGISADRNTIMLELYDNNPWSIVIHIEFFAETFASLCPQTDTPYHFSITDGVMYPDFTCIGDSAIAPDLYLCLTCDVTMQRHSDGTYTIDAKSLSSFGRWYTFHCRISPSV